MEVCGLKSAKSAKHNGRQGTVKGYLPDKGRYTVQMGTNPILGVRININIRRQNLVVTLRTKELTKTTTERPP